MELLVIGDGPHAHSVIDLIRQGGKHRNIGVVTMESSATTSFNNVPVIGRSDQIEQLIATTGVRSFLMAIDDVGVRMNITQRIGRLFPHVEFISVVHPSAVLGSDVVVGAGSVIMAGVHIDTGCTIGEHNLISSHVSIGAESVLGNFVSVGPGASLGYGCHVGGGTAIGTNAALINKIIVGTHCVIGPGAAVIENVPDLHVATGTPARTIRTRLVGERYP